MSPTRLVLLGALGYFVDILDLFLFSVLRVPSLKDLGVPAEQLLPAGVLILNWQMGGLLLGGFLWGVLADRLGRVRVLYGSILLYSLATLANAGVDSVGAYAACRFIAGIGLSGELGAAITLVAESLSPRARGFGTTTVAAVGLCGGIAASLLAQWLPWRVCYVVGGASGLVLLLLRLKLHDPALFVAIRERRDRGDLRLLLGPPRRLLRYLQLVVIGVPIYFVSGLLMVFSPELGKDLGLQGTVSAANAVLYSYLGSALGDLLCGLSSQLLRRRKLAIGLFLAGLAVMTAVYVSARGRTLVEFYGICFLLGLGTGYWAVLLTSAAETFGTNLRATVSTTVPNLIRASIIPITLVFSRWSVPGSRPEAAGTIGLVVVALAFAALCFLPETYERDLAFVEERAQPPA